MKNVKCFLLHPIERSTLYFPVPTSLVSLANYFEFFVMLALYKITFGTVLGLFIF